jgi:two-component system response regulator HydG
MAQQVAARVLVADADLVLAEAIAHSLRRQGFDVVQTTSATCAIERLGATYFDVLVLDIELPDAGSQAVLTRAQAMTAPPLCFLMTSSGDVRSAVDAMRRGAVDYLEKPIDIEALTIRIERALETATMRRRLSAIDQRDRTAAEPVACSPQMQLALRLADRVASSPCSSTLILGESGVGKEVIAARIHERSKRRNGPFVRVNMAAIPESMVEAELFGSVRGAFTDAKRDRLGYFASADGGTLLLDELCEFKVSLQSKLLRALESRSFHPVGSDRERTVNARIIAATNRDPEEAIARGDLRADLYYRLAPVIISVPPLRERREDILPLAGRFLASYGADFGVSMRHLAPDAERALLSYAWPGNARELRNVIERATMLSDNDEISADLLGLPTPATPARHPPTISGAHLRLEMANPVEVLEGPISAPAPSSLGDVGQSALAEAERALIVKALSQAQGSKTRAAELLGVSRTTLWEKVKRYGLK